MFQDVFIIGACGKVGSTLVKQIFEKGDNDSNMHKNPTRIIGLAEEKFFLYTSEGISKKEAMKFVKQPFGQSNDSLNSLLEFVKQNYKNDNLIFIDVTTLKDEMTQFQLKVIKETNFKIVTANKNPLALNEFKTFKTLTREFYRYGYRCSVMAGAEAVAKIRDLTDLGDSPIEIAGCFSGTLGFICSELENGGIFSEIVKKAKQMGYTEPNPANDLSGEDVLKKIIILARTADFDISVQNAILDPFIPKEYLTESNPEKFMAKLKELDALFEKKVASAKKENNVLRYVARFNLIDNKPVIKVGLESVKNNSPIGMLKGTKNKIVLVTKTYGNSSDYSVEAPGAGLEITAQNIRRDLLALISGRIINYR